MKVIYIAIKKRLAALGAAMVMGLSTMSIGTSAANYSTTWSNLRYAPGMTSSDMRLSTTASVKARNSGATVYVNASITRSGNGYLYVTAPSSSNSQSIYKSGQYSIQFTSSNFKKGTTKKFSLSLKKYSGGSIYASGSLSN